MAEKNIFQRIMDREIPAEIVYEDDRCVALRDIDPKAPVHLLVIPRKDIPSIDQLTAEDHMLVGHIYGVIRQLAQQNGLSGGYRVVANCGPDAGQSVHHLHFHLLGGRQFTWPPG